MSAARPVNVADMIAWLRAHPDESFFSLWSRDRLLIGTRSDTGEICAWDCNVQESKMEYDRRASPAPETRTAEPARHAHWCLATKAARTGTLEDCTDCDRVAAEITKGLERAPSPVQGEAHSDTCVGRVHDSLGCSCGAAVQGAETGTGGLPGRGRAK